MLAGPLNLNESRTLTFLRCFDLSFCHSKSLAVVNVERHLAFDVKYNTRRLDFVNFSPCKSNRVAYSGDVVYRLGFISD